MLTRRSTLFAVALALAAALAGCTDHVTGPAPNRLEVTAVAYIGRVESIAAGGIRPLANVTARIVGEIAPTVALFTGSQWTAKQVGFTMGADGRAMFAATLEGQRGRATVYPDTITISAPGFSAVRVIVSSAAGLP